MVLVLKKEVVKTNNVEHEDTGKYRQLLVRTLHQCCIKFQDVAATIIPVVSCQYLSGEGGEGVRREISAATGQNVTSVLYQVPGCGRHHYTCGKLSIS